MAEALAVLSIIDASASLIVKCASVVKSLSDLVAKYKTAELTIKVLIEQVETIKVAWARIQKWTEEYHQRQSTNIRDDDELLEQLYRKLDCGELVLSALEADLEQYTTIDKKSLRPNQRTKLIWNEIAFREHRDRIRDQVSTMSLLLQVLILPTPKDRDQLIKRSSILLQASDDSAYSIIPSRWSRSIKTTSTISDDKHKSDLIYRRLSCEDDLFTAAVYKRSYRSRNKIPRDNSNHPIFSNATLDLRETASKELKVRISALSEARPIDLRANDAVNTSSDPSLDLVQASLSKSEDAMQKFLLSCEFGLAAEVRTGLMDTRILPGLLQKKSSALRLALSLAIRKKHTDVVALLLTANNLILKASAPRTGFLEEAIESGSEAMVDLLISKGLSAQGSPPERCPLHDSIKRGHKLITETLLRHGVITDTCDEDSNYPLHVAVSRGDIETTRLLLEAGASPNSVDKDFQTPLHLAARGKCEISLLLLHHGADLGSQDRWGANAIHLIAKYASPVTLSTMIENFGADLNGKDRQLQRQPIHYAAMGGHAENIGVLFGHGASIDCEDINSLQPLHLALSSYAIEAIRILLYHGALSRLPRSPHLDPLNIAIRQGAWEAVRILVDHSLNVDYVDHEGYRPLNLAISNSLPIDIIDRLIQKGANPNSGLSLLHVPTPLCVAVSQASSTFVGTLLEAGALPDIGGGEYYSPLCHSIQQANFDLAEQLLEKGADPNRCIDKNGDTIFHLVARSAFIRPDLVTASWTLNAIPYKRMLGETQPWGTIYDAPRCHWLQGRTLHLLTKYGADANHRNNRGQSPLSYALRMRDKSVTRFLLQHGAIMPSDKIVSNIAKTLEAYTRQSSEREKNVRNFLSAVERMEPVGTGKALSRELKKQLRLAAFHGDLACL